MVGRPLDRVGQPGAAIQGARVPLEELPLLGRLGQVTVDAQRLAIVRQPLPEGRPLADQRLVRHLGRVRAGRDQPCLHQPAEDRRHRLAVGARGGHELAAARPAGACPGCPHRAPSAAGRSTARSPAGRRRARRGRPGRPSVRSRRARRPTPAYALSVMTLPRRRRQVSSSACDRRGNAPGSSPTSWRIRSTRPGENSQPPASAGASIARRSSSADIGPMYSWCSATAVRKPVVRRQAVVEIGPQREQH